MNRVLGNISCELDTKVKGQIMYFLVYASPPKLLEVATSNFVPEKVTRCTGCLATFRVNLILRSKIKLCIFLYASPPKLLKVETSNVVPE